MVKPSEMPRPLALTGITIHKNTSHQMTKQKKKLGLISATNITEHSKFTYRDKSTHLVKYF